MIVRFSPRSLALPGNAHRRLCLHYISLVPAGECSQEARPPLYSLYLSQSLKLPFPARVWERVQRSSIMFNNGWVDEFLGMFDIYFYMILLIT